jgi:hypothetical protein
MYGTVYIASRVADPDCCDTDTDLALNVDPDPAFHYDLDPHCFKEVMYQKSMGGHLVLNT